MGRGTSDNSGEMTVQPRGELVFLDPQQVEEDYRRIAYPGKSLASAVEAARRRHHYEGEQDLAVLATSILWGVTRAHALLDGNKRASIVLADRFLNLNGCHLEGADDDLYDLAYDAADSQRADEKVALERMRNLLVRGSVDTPFEDRYPDVIYRLSL